MNIEAILQFMDWVYAPQNAFLHLSPYISMTIVGVMTAIMLGAAGFVLARLGYKPLWGLLLIVPYAGVISLWVLAFRKFPREKISP